MTGSLDACVESHLSLALQRTGSCSHEVETQTGGRQVSAGLGRFLHREKAWSGATEGRSFWLHCGGCVEEGGVDSPFECDQLPHPHQSQLRPAS